MDVPRRKLAGGIITPLRRIAMINVTLVHNGGAGLPVKTPVVEGTTLEKFLEVAFDGDVNDFTIRVRANGTSVTVHSDYVLQDEDRVSLAPIKVDGATL